MPEPTPGSVEWNLRVCAWELLLTVANERPSRAGSFTTHATLVSWERLEALRDALVACGPEWGLGSDA